MEEKLPKRKSARLKNFDYSTPGGYFITICTHNKECTLSHIVGAIHESPEMELTAYGEIVDRIIGEIPYHFNATVDRYVIMPNHVHLLLLISQENSRALHEAPLRTRSTLSRIIGFLKMHVSKEIHTRYGNVTVWQRGFHDHIIRNQNDYDRIAKYIFENPIRWQSDCFYTAM